MSTTFDDATKRNLDLWLTGDYDEKTKSKIRKMLDENPKEVVDAFYTTLSFGTGGLRGIMGVGSNRMNVYTVRAATQGLANYINQQGAKDPSVFIGFDSRHNSLTFAEEAAKVLAGNGIKVYLCKELRPTPFVSFGCRYHNCQSAIMITASHNPAAYNGYKVYWSDGGQVVPPHDTGIIDEVNKVTDVATVESLSHPLIEYVGPEVDEAYYDAITPLQHYPRENAQYGKDLKVVYSSLHGTGITLAPEALKRWGFTNLSFVEKQIIPDGDFPTVKSPNPEEKETLKMGIALMEQNNADLFIANDPDADRVGLVVMHKGESVILNGNQIACICLEHLLEALTKQGKIPKKGALVKTIVTTELFKQIANHFKVTCFNVLTGFKYIAEKIHQWEQETNSFQYIFGGEESYGYLLGTETRDKDAITSSALICEAALHAKREGKTLVDKLDDLYNKYGLHVEKLLSICFEESKIGKEKIKTGMHNLESAPPEQVFDTKVIAIENFNTSLKTFLDSGKTEPISFPKSNVLLFWLADGTKLIVRPSGTEPKIKIYCGVSEKGVSPAALEQRAQSYIDWIKATYFTTIQVPPSKDTRRLPRQV